jgi:hypothetical protein
VLNPSTIIHSSPVFGVRVRRYHLSLQYYQHLWKPEILVAFKSSHFSLFLSAFISDHREPGFKKNSLISRSIKRWGLPVFMLLGFVAWLSRDLWSYEPISSLSELFIYAILGGICVLYCLSAAVTAVIVETNHSYP